MKIKIKFRVYALPAAVLTLARTTSLFAQNDAGTPPATNSAPENRPIPSKILIFPPKNSGDGTVTASRSNPRPGQRVAFTFTISNSTKKTVGYDFPSSQHFDITVSDSNGTQVWDWAQGRAFAQTITFLSLKPGQKKSFTAAWNGRDAQGRLVTPGVYTVNARMTSSDRPAITGSLVVDPDTDPNNTGFPTRSPAENGAVRQVDVTPPITAFTTLTMGVPAHKR